MLSPYCVCVVEFCHVPPVAATLNSLNDGTVAAKNRQVYRHCLTLKLIDWFVCAGQQVEEHTEL